MSYERSALLLPMIVERAKRCLDFTSTLYIIHLGICSFYDGIPQNWEWWILQIAALALMVVLGEADRLIVFLPATWSRRVALAPIVERKASI